MLHAFPFRSCRSHEIHTGKLQSYGNQKTHGDECDEHRGTMLDQLVRDRMERKESHRSIVPALQPFPTTGAEPSQCEVIGESQKEQNEKSGGEACA